MKINFKIILLLFLSFFTTAGNAKSPSKKQFLKDNFDFASKQIQPLANLNPETDGYPRTIDPNGALHTTKRNDWTEGFFPGSLWYIYEFTHDKKIKQEAVKWTLPLEKLQYITSHHDIGFLMYCSYGNAYRLTGDELYKKILIQSAKSLCTRYDSTTKVLKSWNYRESWDKKHKWYYPVIIDNMMNLELLYFATKVTGDKTFSNIATQHALTTMKNHFRPDNSSYHVVNYDPKTGAVEFRGTCQGYADNSTWARGQSWAIYGFTLVYRETKDKRFLEFAEKLADWWLNNTNLPNDMVPYWDFNANQTNYSPADWTKLRTDNKTFCPRDASAAAVTCSALFELSTFSKNKEKYYNAAVKTLNSLASPAYRAELNQNKNFLIMHSVGSLPHGSEIDVPLVYADYYYLEALLWYKKLR